MRWTAVFSIVAALLLLPAVAGAQESPPEADPLNHAYAVYMGSGLYVSSGRSVFVFRLAPTIKLRSEEDHPFGVRLRLNATFGFYDLKTSDLQELDIPDQLGTFALVPGVEFPIRIKEKWTLTPFLDAGVATDTSIHENTIVVGTGLRSRAALHDSRHTYLLWNELVRARNSSTKVSSSDDYALFRTDFEMRGLVGYRLGKRPFDLGLVAETDLYFDSVIIELPAGAPISINYRWELGLSTGSTEPWKHFKNMVTAPRLGIGYRSGDGDSSIRFTIRFRN